MTKSQRKLFTERVEKVFEIMSFMPPPMSEWTNKVTAVENIKQLNSDNIVHRLMFIKNERTLKKTLRHDVWERKNNIERNLLTEHYGFHPKRKKKFELLSICSGLIYIKLFERWSRMDIEDLLIQGYA